jgi:L-ascorbate metabolism protein UlaG (beta-lactamase superfamily)
MKITYLSHSCFLVETAEARIVIDPFLTGNPMARVGAGEIACDYIIVTHGHEDHFGDAVAIARRTGATVIGNFEVAMTCANQGAKAHPMNVGGAYRFPFGRVKLTLAHHSSGQASGQGFSYLGNPCGVVLTAGGKTLYHAGDTALFLDMQLIGELDRIDVALLPIGDNFTMGPEDAARAAEFLKAGLSVPMHFNTFDLIRVDPAAFVKAAAARGRRARVLEVGETLAVE